METWIGLFNIKPNEGNQLLSRNAKGAYVNVLALAINREQFIKMVVNAFGNMDFEIEDYQDVELFKSRKLKADISNEILELAGTISSKNSIVFDVFHSYLAD